MNKKITIYYSGNPLLKEDALVFKIIPRLEKIFPKINFVHHDPNENLPDDNDKIIIIDTVINTDKVIIVSDINKLNTQDVYSPHDWDLALNLRLLYKLGKIKKIQIIGIPPQGRLDEIISQTALFIKKATAS